MEFLTNNLGLLGGLGGRGLTLFILKKIPNEQICKYVEGLFFGLGSAMTLGLAKWSFSAKIWNKTIEPFFVDLIDNIVGGALRGFLRGLRSDNK